MTPEVTIHLIVVDLPVLIEDFSLEENHCDPAWEEKAKQRIMDLGSPFSRYGAETTDAVVLALDSAGIDIVESAVWHRRDGLPGAQRSCRAISGQAKGVAFRRHASKNSCSLAPFCMPETPRNTKGGESSWNVY